MNQLQKYLNYFITFPPLVHYICDDVFYYKYCYK